MNARTLALQAPVQSRLTAIVAAVLVVLAAFVPAATARADEGKVKTRAVPQTTKVAQGSQIVVAVEMDMGDKLHAWPEAGVKLPDSIADFAIRTELALPSKDPGGASIAQPTGFALKSIQYPKAKTGKVPDPSGMAGSIDAPLYSGLAISYATVTVAKDAPLGDATLTFILSYQACDDKVCFAPEDIVLPVKLTVVAAGTQDLGTRADDKLFAGYSASAATPPAPPASTAAPASSAQGASFFGFDIGRNIAVLAIAAILAGAILNLTPCVLPVIPIKIMSLTQHAKTRRDAIVLGLWMFAGVVAFWSVIGLPMALINANLDPSQFIFGYWYITLGIGLVIALMGLGIMGLFNLNLPQSVYMIETKADSPVGSFFYGVLAAVLGLPCFGFMAGGLLAIAASLPASSIMVIFIGLGVGMGAPYLVLSTWPQLLRFIPRTGPASELIKQVMGLLLLAAAGFFVNAGIQVLLKEMPYLAGSMGWWVVTFFIGVAGLWLFIRTLQISRTFVPRAVFSILAIGMIGVTALFAWYETSKEYTNHRQREEALAKLGGAGGFTGAQAPAGVWLDYTPELLASLRAANRPVFLEFTASWCLSCKAIKASTLDPMKSELGDRGLVLLEVDCSARSGAGSKFLTELGRTGVPAWAVYAPGSDKPHFLAVEKPTASNVRTELDGLGIRATAVTSRSTLSDK